MPSRRNLEDDSDRSKIAKIAKDAFENMSDADFFSSRVKHLYFYGPVTRDSVLTLKASIRQANRDVVSPSIGGPTTDPVIVAPLPIVIHVNSFGGEAHAMQTIFSAFAESRMPICAIVDGVSASASTILTAGAPYRVIVPSSASLFHEWSMRFDRSVTMRKPDVEMTISEMAMHDVGYYDAIQKRSKMTKEQLKTLTKRDLFLDSKQCLQKGFADRLLAIGKKGMTRTKMRIHEIREVLRDPLVNHVTVMPDKESDENVVDPVVLELDRILQQDTKARKTVVVHFNQGYTEDIDKEMTHSFYSKTVPLLTRLRVLSDLATNGSNLIGVVDSIIDVVSAIPFLHCKVRSMYSSAIFVIHAVYGRASAMMLDDVMENTKTTFSEVRKILTERTKLPKKILDHMHETRIVLNAKQCLDYGIVDVLL